MNTIVLALSLLNPQSDLSSATWEIEGTPRTGLVYKAAQKPAPTVFAFHGHGGNAGSAARSFKVHEIWPEANVVYLQGLPTKTGNDPEGKRNGWHNAPGEYGDRDLKLFDAVLKQGIDQGWIDAKRVFAMGHSNGGRFTYLLWATRGEKFAAFGPSAAACRGLDSLLKPNNVVIVAGKNDEVVPFDRQSASIETVKKLLECKPSSEAKDIDLIQILPGSNNKELGLMIHNGTHKYPENATKMIVTFFKRHQRP